MARLPGHRLAFLAAEGSLCAQKGRIGVFSGRVSRPERGAALYRDVKRADTLRIACTHTRGRPPKGAFYARASR
jgi:(2Fe-2S) ferredoxin